MRRGGARTLTLLSLSLLLLASACSGAVDEPGPGLAAEGPPNVVGTEPAMPGEVRSPAPRTQGTTGPTRAPSEPTRAATGATRTPGTATTPRPEARSPEIRPANLFRPSEDRVGLTDSTIRICTHNLYQLGPVLDFRQEDAQVYWRWLNARGGILDRKVEFYTYDDKNSAQGTREAVEQCDRVQPFLVAGSAGLDGMPVARQWAEESRMLYLAYTGVKADALRFNFTYNIIPTVHQWGLVLARFLAKNHPRNVGMVWRNSPNFRESRDGFRSGLGESNIKLVADISVQQNQGDYSSVILELRRSNAQTVFAIMSVMEQAQLIKQASAQGYNPRWALPTNNFVLKAIGSELDGTGGPPAVGISWVPEYHPGDRETPWSGLVKQMEDAYRTYRPGKQPNEFDWWEWTRNVRITKMLTDCGSDCTRNRLAGMFLGGYRHRIPPQCDVDFGRGGGHLGGWQMNVQYGTRYGNESGWRQVATCKERF